MTKRILTPSDVAKGQTRNMLAPSSVSDIDKTFRAPSLSLSDPEPILPTAEAALNAAASPAPVLGEKPTDLANKGMQNGGTKAGNVPTAPARKSSTKLADPNRLLCTPVSFASYVEVRQEAPIDESALFVRELLLDHKRSR